MLAEAFNRRASGVDCLKGSSACLPLVAEAEESEDHRSMVRVIQESTTLSSKPRPHKRPFLKDNDDYSRGRSRRVATSKARLHGHSVDLGLFLTSGKMDPR